MSPVFPHIPSRQVKATDLDSGSFATIRYSITRGNDDDSFAIDNTTGVITNRRQLDYEHKTSYTLTVEAKDQAHQQAR